MRGRGGDPTPTLRKLDETTSSPVSALTNVCLEISGRVPTHTPRTLVGRDGEGPYHFFPECPGTPDPPWTPPTTPGPDPTGQTYLPPSRHRSRTLGLPVSEGSVVTDEVGPGRSTFRTNRPSKETPLIKDGRSRICVV